MTARQKARLRASVRRILRKAFRDAMPDLDALMAETLERRKAPGRARSRGTA